MDTVVVRRDRLLMATRYQQLVELYDKAHARANERRDAAAALASALVKEVVKALGIPADLHTGSDRKKLAIELCALADDRSAILTPTKLPDAVTTTDGETFRFGIIVRLFSQAGFPPHSVLFRVNMKHELNDRFQVTSSTDTTAHVYAVGGAHSEPLNLFSDALVQSLTDYFSAGVREQAKRPVGFELLNESA